MTVSTGQLSLQGGKRGAGSRVLRLVDGGVYDNMADQWAAGYPGRVGGIPDRYRDRAPDDLIVVNASSGAEWTATPMLGTPIIGEIRALTRDVSILYDNTTTQRRFALVDRFDLARERATGLRGTYVGIDQSPYRVARFFADHDEFGARATAVLSLLDAGPITEAEWAVVADASDTMSTNLSRLDADAAGDVVWHAHVLTMCNLHVLLDYPLTASLPPRDRFRT